jgi:hypothetical protein
MSDRDHGVWPLESRGTRRQAIGPRKWSLPFFEKDRFNNAPRDQVLLPGPFHLSKNPNLLKTVRRVIKGERLVTGFIGDLQRQPMAALPLRLNSKDHSWSGITNNQGIYEAWSLPMGEYRLGTPQPGFVMGGVVVATAMFEKLPSDLSSLTVEKSGCLIPNALAFAGGTISGRVINSDGKPVPHHRVTLESNRQQLNSVASDLLSTTSTASGHFVFPAVPVASYHVTNSDWVPEHIWNSGWFVPKYASTKSKLLISVANGQAIRNVQIKLSEIRVVPVTMVAVNRRGVGLKAISVQLYDAQGHLGFPKGQTNARGELTILLGEGESYSLTAIHPDDGENGDRRSDTIPFIAKRGQRLVVIVP